MSAIESNPQTAPELTLVFKDKDDAVVEVIADSNSEPARVIHDAGSQAVSHYAEVKVVDEHSGYEFRIDRDGQVGPVGEENGELEVTLGERHVDPEGGSFVADVEVSVHGVVVSEALVPVEEMQAQAFIPAPGQTPRIRFNFGDLKQRLIDGEEFRLGPRVSAVAALATSAFMSGQGAGMVLDDGRHRYYSHPRYED